MRKIDQKQQFQERIARIASASGAPVGSNKVPGELRPLTLAEFLANARYPAGILAAFLLGAIAVFITRYVRFHLGYGALTGETADMMMVTDMIMAVVVGFLLRHLFHFEAREFQLAHGLGVIAMVLGMHNFVHWAPQAFTTLFSRDWMIEVIQTTEPDSLLFRGVSIVLTDPGDHPAAEAGRPRVIKLDSERR